MAMAMAMIIARCQVVARNGRIDATRVLPIKSKSTQVLVLASTRSWFFLALALDCIRGGRAEHMRAEEVRILCLLSCRTCAWRGLHHRRTSRFLLFAPLLHQRRLPFGVDASSPFMERTFVVQSAVTPVLTKVVHACVYADEAERKGKPDGEHHTQAMIKKAANIVTVPVRWVGTAQTNCRKSDVRVRCTA